MKEAHVVALLVLSLAVACKPREIEVPETHIQLKRNNFAQESERQIVLSKESDQTKNNNLRSKTEKQQTSSDLDRDDDDLEISEMEEEQPQFTVEERVVQQPGEQVSQPEATIIEDAPPPIESIDPTPVPQQVDKELVETPVELTEQEKLLAQLKKDMEAKFAADRAIIEANKVNVAAELKSYEQYPFVTLAVGDIFKLTSDVPSEKTSFNMVTQDNIRLKWQVVAIKDGYVQVKVITTDLSLNGTCLAADPYGTSGTKSQTACQADPADNQLWAIRSVNNNKVVLLGKATGMCIQADGRTMFPLGACEAVWQIEVEVKPKEPEPEPFRNGSSVALTTGTQFILHPREENSSGNLISFDLKLYANPDKWEVVATKEDFLQIKSIESGNPSRKDKCLGLQKSVISGVDSYAVLTVDCQVTPATDQLWFFEKDPASELVKIKNVMLQRCFGLSGIQESGCLFDWTVEITKAGEIKAVDPVVPAMKLELHDQFVLEPTLETNLNGVFTLHKDTDGSPFVWEIFAIEGDLVQLKIVNSTTLSYQGKCLATNTFTSLFDGSSYFGSEIVNCEATPTTKQLWKMDYNDQEAVSFRNTYSNGCMEYRFLETNNCRNLWTIKKQ